MTQDRHTARPRGYQDAMADLARAQKPGYGVPAYLRWVNRRLGRHLAAAAFVLRLTPNALSAIGGLLTLVGLLLVGLGPRGPIVGAASAIALLAGYAFDSADGQLARLTRTGSAAGEWLDHVIDSARQPAFHLAIAASFIRNPEPDVPWLPVVAVAFSLVASVWFFAQILAEKLSDGGTKSSDTGTSSTWTSFVKSPYDCSFGYFLIFAIAMPMFFSVVYLGWFAFTVIVAALSLARKYQTLKGQQPSAPEVVI